MRANKKKAVPLRPKTGTVYFYLMLYVQSIIYVREKNKYKKTELGILCLSDERAISRSELEI